jgi:alkylation response protein AidB-like acyl-CoA dehydrogenase
MDSALDLTLEYLRTRVQFGKPIGSFQALQHRAVDLYIQKELSRAALEAASAALADQSCTPERRAAAASSAKARAAQAALAICNEALQMHGAIGFTDEYDLGLYLNRALVLSAWLGNASAHRHRYSSLVEAAA